MGWFCAPGDDGWCLTAGSVGDLMAEPETIPLADEPPEPAPESRAAGVAGAREPGQGRRRRGGLAAVLVLVAGCLAHGALIWRAMGGAEGINGPWPLWRDDHPLYYHSALVTRAFLSQSGTTAGYDPAFMAGYPKSVVFPASSTLPELVVWAFGGDQPARAYKLYVLVASAIAPWLVAWACGLWRLRLGAAAAAVWLYLAYVWADFPINYVALGMVPYFLAIPLSLVAAGAFGRFLESGGLLRWLAAALLCSAAFLVHLTAGMIVAPAGAFAYLGALRGKPGARPGVSRHVGVWLVPAVVLVLNAFWWLPALWLSETKGASDFVFRHPEGVLTRLAGIATNEAPIEPVLIALGLPGLAVLLRRSVAMGWTLVGFVASGLFWGYLAGGVRAFDFLQPGRHTYAFYTGLALAAGPGLDAFLRRLRPEEGAERSVRLDRWALLALVLVGARIVGTPLAASVQARVGGTEPYLTSQPPPRFFWILDRIKAHAKPGQRVLYEEGGFAVPGIPDPYRGGRFSGLIPSVTGVELIGGPYLHAALKTNFTQFGEAKLFEEADWDRDFFVRYARLYRPSLMVCWTPRARRFCQANPDLATVVDDDGTILVAKISGFEGDAVRGAAEVTAAAGRLTVRRMVPDLDGSVVLRYHHVPSLRAHPDVPVDAQFEEGDPVPLIRIRPPEGVAEVELEMVPPVPIPWAPSR